MLKEADADLTAGDYDSISAKLWSAVEHAVVTVAVKRGWECEDDKGLFAVVQRFEEESGDDLLVRGFNSESIFYDNTRYTFLEDYEIEYFSTGTRRFVSRILAYLD